MKTTVLHQLITAEVSRLTRAQLAAILPRVRTIARRAAARIVLPPSVPSV